MPLNNTTATDKRDKVIHGDQPPSRNAVPISEAARLCGVTPRTIRRMLLDKRLEPGPQLGRTGTVTRASLETSIGVDTTVPLDLSGLPDAALRVLSLVVRNRRGDVLPYIELAAWLEAIRRNESKWSVDAGPLPAVVFRPGDGDSTQVLDEAKDLVDLAQWLLQEAPRSESLQILHLWVVTLRSRVAEVLASNQPVPRGTMGRKRQLASPSPNLAEGESTDLAAPFARELTESDLAALGSFGQEGGGGRPGNEMGLLGG